MNNIYLVVGPSGVGKSTLVEQLEKRYGYTSLSSYTDRPKRYEGETGHVFITKEEFDRLPGVCALTHFHNYRYCSTSEQVDNADLYIVDIDGIRYMQKAYSGRKGIIVFGLVEDENILRRRMANRGDSRKAIEGRIEHDRIAFKDLPCLATHLVKMSSVDAVCDFVHEAILHHERMAEAEEKGA